jgi:hypothetical protein
VHTGEQLLLLCGYVNAAVREVAGGPFELGGGKVVGKCIKPDGWGGAVLSLEGSCCDGGDDHL